MKTKLWAIPAVFLSLTLLTACGEKVGQVERPASFGTSSSDNSGLDDINESKSCKNYNREGKSVEGKVGDTLEVVSCASTSSQEVKLKITVSEYLTAPTPVSSYASPYPGKKFNAAKVQVENASDTSQSVSLLSSFKAIDENSQSTSGSSYPTISQGSVLPYSVNLTSGEKVAGYVIFEVPTTSTTKSIKYETYSSTSDKGVWTIQ